MYLHQINYVAFSEKLSHVKISDHFEIMISTLVCKQFQYLSGMYVLEKWKRVIIQTEYYKYKLYSIVLSGIF